MTTQKIEDYLTKQLFISKNIVTYRSLSREFEIHVNTAKNELAAFHAKKSKSPDHACFATYLVSGEALDGRRQGEGKDKGSDGDVDMDVDYGFTPTPTLNYGFAGAGKEEDGEDGEVVVQVRMTVVGEDGLEDAKAEYVKVTSVHVYSLSPSPIRDADLLCAPMRRIRELDNQKGVEMAKAVGRIIGEDIKMKEGGTKTKGRITATTTAQQAAPRLKAGPSVSGPSGANIKSEEKDNETAKEESKKPKQTGKLNFFAPKAQNQPKDKEKASSKSVTEGKNKMFFGAATKSAASSAKESPPAAPPPPPKEEKPKEADSVKRGTKRKSIAAVLSDDEDETKPTSAAPSGLSSRRSSSPPSARSSPQPTKAMSKLRLHKSAILSDDEDDEQPRRKAVKKLRRKASVRSDDEVGRDSEATKEAAKALKSMMEMDDDQVEKVSRKAKVEALRQEEEEGTEPERETPATTNKDEDVDMSDGTEVKHKPKPRKKKEKKVVPVGRNGLKKRRIMKSRTRIDEKGYMVTEDYSSYESVEEEEEEIKKPTPAKRGNGNKRAAASKKEKEESTEPPAPEGPAVSAVTPSGDAKSKPTTKAASSSTKSSTNKTGTASKGGQKQKTLNTFFGAPKAKK